MFMTNEQPKTEKPISAKQAAEILGLNPKTVLRMASLGKLPAYRIGDLWKFKRSEIEAWFDAQRVRPEQNEGNKETEEAA